MEVNRTLEERLTKSEWRIVRCVADDCLTVRETSDKLCVVYQCVANHLQTIYDKLGIKRNLQALTKWYYTEGGRRVGTAVLLLIFSVEIANANFEGRIFRTPRRGRRNEVENAL